MENHGKIMEFDSGKVLGTLYKMCCAMSDVKGDPYEMNPNAEFVHKNHMLNQIINNRNENTKPVQTLKRPPLTGGAY